MESERYPTDLKDEEWAIIAGLFTKSEKRGKKPNNDMRRIVDGCFYLLRGGISWRMMPHDLPPWKEVYYYLDKWRKNGKWERINQVLREQYRTASGRRAGAWHFKLIRCLSAGCADLQQPRRIGAHALGKPSERQRAAQVGDDAIGQPPQRAHGGRSDADATGILVQGDIEDMMHRLHAPVRPGAAGILAGRQRSAADVVVDGRDDAVLGDAGALDAAEAADAINPGRGGHPGDDLGISEGSGAARLVTAVPAVLGRVGRACCLVEGRPHGVEQRALVGLHG